MEATMHYLLLILVAFFGLLILSMGFSRWLLKTSARKLYEQQKTVYSGKHEFMTVSPRIFPWLDIDYYDNVAARLRRLDFRHLGDVEDKTATLAFPSMRTFVRVLQSADGAVTAGVYQVKPRGFTRLFTSLGLIPRDMRVLDLESELNNGTFLATSNGLGLNLTAEVNGITRQLADPATPVEELLRLHRETLGKMCAETSELQALAWRSMEEILASQERMQELKNARKAALGYVDAEEIARVAAGSLSEEGKALTGEMARLRKDEERRRPGRR